MFDAQCDVAALVYQGDEDPDRVLHDFAVDLNARGVRAAGLVQLGHRRRDGALSAMLVHSGETLSLFSDAGPRADGRRLDTVRLIEAGAAITRAIDRGAEIVIVNRFGRQESEGKGLAHVVEHALTVDVPVVIAVPGHRFAHWIRFAAGMTVKLPCERRALDDWWNGIRGSFGRRPAPHRTICEIIK
jgi:hypothetical protein